MLLRIVSLKRYICWLTTEIIFLYDSNVISKMFTPFNFICPAVGSYILVSKLIIVDFPEPFFPISTVLLPLGISILTSVRIGLSVSYEKKLLPISNFQTLAL